MTLVDAVGLPVQAVLLLVVLTAICAWMTFHAVAARAAAEIARADAAMHRQAAEAAAKRAETLYASTAAMVQETASRKIAG